MASFDLHMTINARASWLLIVEHAKRDAAPEQVERLVRAREMVQGDSALAFYKVP